MANIATVLRSEIARVARRAVRTETEQLKKSASQYRGQIAELKRQVAGLQTQVTHLSKANGKTQPVAAPVDASTVRFSPDKLKKHRERLELSAEKFAKLFGVTGQTVRNWEAGTRPDMQYLVRIAQLRRLTKRHAHALVAERS